ncbi:hypothetical protein P8C59_005257 [Phyllachora maydis]|uniref:Uncharacterized protein n=1 Tax=Phyllachora maydis TaxID=1825666 RepID=A0AAD9MEA5_9PEZI|nr:hypothetical protein P8C59_005257 [Phyllachora maydis]
MYIMLLTRYLNSTKDYSICFSYNGNIVADLGPKLSNSSNITTELSRDFYSKEGPRPLTTTSTTIVDSRNSKGSSRTSIINSSLVPIGFSDSDFAGDKATSKSTYGYLYKLAGGPISWKTKRATTIALSTLEAETDGLTEAIREVQWIIGLFSELHRPIDYPITLYGDNQGSITVANDPALHARTKHTLLKFRYVREQVKDKIVTIIYLNTKCRNGPGGDVPPICNSPSLRAYITMAQTPRQRQANAKFVKDQEARRGKSEEQIKKRTKELPPSPISPVLLGILAFIIFGGLVFEALSPCLVFVTIVQLNLHPVF